MAEHKVYVGGLSYNATEDDLYDFFGKYVDNVKNVFLPTDRETGKPRGFAFVEFNCKEDCDAAINGGDGKEIQGRAIKCNMAKPRGDGGGSRSGGGGYGGGGGQRSGGYGGGGGQRSGGYGGGGGGQRSGGYGGGGGQRSGGYGGGGSYGSGGGGYGGGGGY